MCYKKNINFFSNS
jgi:hypothetical protein